MNVPAHALQERGLPRPPGNSQAHTALLDVAQYSNHRSSRWGRNTSSAAFLPKLFSAREGGAPPHITRKAARSITRTLWKLMPSWESMGGMFVSTLLRKQGGSPSQGHATPYGQCTDSSKAASPVTLVWESGTARQNILLGT